MAVTKVVMPKLSDAMESGKIIKWLKKEGDPVQGGDILAEIETDKADVEMEAFGAGVLRKILVSAGDRVPVGGLIGVIADPGEDISSVAAAAPAAPAEAEPAAPAHAAVPPQPRSEDPAARQPSAASAPAAPSRPTQVAARVAPSASVPTLAPVTQATGGRV